MKHTAGYLDQSLGAQADLFKSPHPSGQYVRATAELYFWVGPVVNGGSLGALPVKILLNYVPRFHVVLFAFRVKIVHYSYVT